MKTFTLFLLLTTVAALWLACRGQQAPPLTSGIEGHQPPALTCLAFRHRLLRESYQTKRPDRP